MKGGDVGVAARLPDEAAEVVVGVVGGTVNLLSMKSVAVHLF